MVMNYATIAARITEHDTEALPGTRATLYATPQSTGAMLTYNGDTRLTLGTVDARFAPDGTATIKIPLDTDLPGLLWTFTLEVKDTRGNPTRRDLGTYSITGNATLTAMVQPDVLAVDATFQTTVAGYATRAEDAATRAEAVGDTNDTVTVGLLNDPASATRVKADSLYALTINVKGYGAVGNGVANDTAALQAALNAAAAAKGSVVHVPAGRYLYTADLTIPSGVTVEGVGPRGWASGATTADRQLGSMLVPGANAARILVQGVSGSVTTHVEAVALRDLTIDGSTTTAVGVRVWDALDVTLERVFIRACVKGLECGTTTATDYIENLRLRDVKITNGTTGVDSTGSATKVFIDATGLHVRNMTQAAVRGAYSGSFVGGFVGRVGTSGAGDGKAFDLINPDGVTLIGIPFENIHRGVLSTGSGRGVNVLGCIFSASDPGFGIVRGVDLQNCDGWSVVGSRFLFNNAAADAVGIFGTASARYGYAAGNQFQGPTGSQLRVSMANPGVNTIITDGRLPRLDADHAYIGDGAGAPILGLGGAGGSVRSLTYYTGAPGLSANQRWNARASSAAEAGANAGSDYELVSYSDAGGSASVRLRLRRSDGRLTVFGSLQNASYTTAARPTPASVGVGGQVFDTTLNRPIWSTGSVWVDAAGVAV